MRESVSLIFILTVVMGCSDANDANDINVEQASSSNTQRNGSISVGDESWTISVLKQCSIYPGGIVNIWGLTDSEPSHEVIMDFGGPTGVKIGEAYPPLWQAEKETLEIQINGSRLEGTATFFRYAAGTKEVAQGSFEINC